MSDAPSQVKHHNLDDMIHMDESVLERALHIDEEDIQLEEEFQWDGPPLVPDHLLPGGPPEGPPEFP